MTNETGQVNPSKRPSQNRMELDETNVENHGEEFTKVESRFLK